VGSGSGSGSIPAASGHPPHGMPIARSVTAHAVAGVVGGAGGGSGTLMDVVDGADDGADADDGRLYCWCQMGSFGDMVACDDNECECEWFHFGCIGLEVTPEGVWFVRVGLNPGIGVRSRVRPRAGAADIRTGMWEVTTIL